MSWDIPTGDRCPECNEPLVLTARGNIKCSNKDCSYKVRVQQPKKETVEFQDDFEPPYPEEPVYDNGGYIFTGYENDDE